MPGAVASRGEVEGLRWCGDGVGGRDNSQSFVGLRFHFEHMDNEMQCLSVKHWGSEMMSFDILDVQFEMRQDNVYRTAGETARLHYIHNFDKVKRYTS